MILKGSNLPKLDKNGYVEAVIGEPIQLLVDTETGTLVNRENGEVLKRKTSITNKGIYECLEWPFVWQGLQNKPGTHYYQTGEDLNAGDENGVLNAVSELCMRLGVVTMEELAREGIAVDTDLIVGLRVRYKMSRNEKKQYIMDADTLELIEHNGKGKDKR
jgi:hypothetical protein